MKARTPVVDPRNGAQVLADLHQHLAGYTPAWAPREGAASGTLMRIFARYLEILLTGLNQVPDRNFLAFLDSLGFHLLPAKAARVPLVFSLLPESPIDSTLPANSQVAAPAPVQPPSPLLENQDEATATEPAVFATTRTVTLTRAHLAALYSLDPGSDAYADHSQRLTTGFTLFDDMGPVEHAIYLGHDELLALAGEADVRLSFNLGVSARGDSGALELKWEYLSEDGWMPLSLDEDGTAGLTQGGQLLLRKACGPDAIEETFHGHTSFWLRGQLSTPLPSQGSSGGDIRPTIDTIRASVGFTKGELAPEAAFTDALTVDTSNNFYPFGELPARHTTFFLASSEVFQRTGARIGLEIELAEPGGTQNADLRLAWEYYDGAAWRPLDNPRFEFHDGTRQFTAGSTETLLVSFLAPLDWSETEVNGEQNYWLRVRIDRGDYGSSAGWKVVTDGDRESRVEEDTTLEAPVVSRLRLRYTYQTRSTPLDHCLTFNGFVFSDQSHACRWARRVFEPFKPLADQQPAVYFGFDQRLPPGLISLYLHVPPEVAESDVLSEALPFVWEYRAAHGWTELGVLDETLGFRRSGMLQFIGPSDAVRVPGLGDDLYRIRARLKGGERLRTAPVAGMWLNAVWGTHRRVFQGDILGSSDGNPHQTFRVPRGRAPVLEDEVIEVREWNGRGADWETVVQNVPEKDLRKERDPVTDQVTAVWVRWHGCPHLYRSRPNDRHYVIERATGLLRFGDNRYGMIPPAGARLIASYASGGGLVGNLPADTIVELRTAEPFVTGVTNPVEAAGGAASESIGGVRARGPQWVRHRGRGVASGDLVWLAREASPEVARARCLPITGPAGSGQRGWVTLVIVPHSTAAQPGPTPELKRRVQAYLAKRVPATVARRVRVLGPQYVPVGVVAEVVPRQPEDAAQVDARVLDRLNRFLHPLSGGPESQGWSFGQPVYQSHIAAVIENTPGVDYAPRIELRVNGQMFDEMIPVDRDSLVAAGDHELKLMLGEA